MYHRYRLGTQLSQQRARLTDAKSGVPTSMPAIQTGCGEEEDQRFKVIFTYIVWASLDYMSLSQEKKRKKDGSENIFDV